MSLTKEPKPEFEASKSSKIDEIYNSLAIDPKSVEATLKKREQQLALAERAEELIVLYETLITHQENLRSTIDEVEEDRRKVSEGELINRLPKVNPEMADLFKELYGVEDPQDLLDSGTVKIIRKYNVYDLPQGAKKKLDLLFGFFTKSELGLNEKDTQSINEDIVNLLDIKLDDYHGQLETIDSKLRETEQKLANFK